MLHTETVEKETLDLLQLLMQDQEFANFYLVGGTALALYMGHRISIDLDLFTPCSYNHLQLHDYLIKKYDFQTIHVADRTLMGKINGVKVDFIAYEYPYVEQPLMEEGIRMCAVKDISAMKLSAIADSGTRLKDFVDIAFLSAKLSFFDMLEAYQYKFKTTNIIHPIKGITFFGDIDFDVSLTMVEGTYQWNKIKKRLYAMSKDLHKVFDTYPI